MATLESGKCKMDHASGAVFCGIGKFSDGCHAAGTADSEDAFVLGIDVQHDFALQV